MDRKYNKGLSIKIITSIRKDQKRHIPKVEHNETKNVVLINIDKISVISIDDIIDELISKFTEKVKDTITFIWFIHIFSGMLFISSLSINAIKYNKLYSI